MSAPEHPDAVAEFESHRHHLFGIAYRMLGQVSEAEDAVQDAWLRWDAADRSTIERPVAWLTTVVSRISLDRLKSAQHQRETYVGPWLPEPLLAAVDDPTGDPEQHAELADSLSLAFLHLLERLDPIERAAFLLREVFGHDYADVAATVDRSETNCRQIVHRAKERLDPDRPVRFDPGPDEERRLVDSFLGATLSGDLDGLRAMLADDVVVWSDGGAKQYAARRPVLGRERAAIFITGIAGKRERLHDTIRVEYTRINGDPGILVYGDDHLFMAMAFELRPDGIGGIYSILNADKLDHLDVSPS